MKMKIFFLFLCIYSVSCLPDLKGTEKEKCFRCICYASTLCTKLSTCVEKDINYTYWEAAGSPTPFQEEPSSETYRDCMANENCVLNTIDAYSKGRGSRRDTNCDNKFDCKDRLAIHFNGVTANYTLKKWQIIRFDNCAVENGLEIDEGWKPCPIIEINELLSKPKL